MAPDVHMQLEEELNFLAEYAGLPESFTFFVTDSIKRRGCSDVRVKGSEQDPRLVDTACCLANLKRLPDHTCKEQMIHCLLVSHPDRKGKSETRPRNGDRPTHWR